MGNRPVIVKNKKAAARAARREVVDDGLESNGHTTYDHEVKFENIKVTANIVRVKDDDPDTGVGVAKGAILAGVPITVPSNTSAATMHAMKKRCDFKPTLSQMDAFKIGHELLMSKFEPQEEIRVDSALMQEYFEKCGGAKAERLLAALEADTWHADMATKHVFAKQEVLLKAHQSQPRVVYQGTDMYNALTGPVVMELNNRMKNIFSRSNPLNTGNVVIYACGASGEELGDIMEAADGSPVESDMKNNDGSQSGEFRKPEAMFYLKLGAPVWFVREFARTTSIRVWTRYGVAATIDGERWSGETTTTTGNSYVSMCLVQAALRAADIEKSTNIHGGDDYLGYIDGSTEKFKAAVEDTAAVSGMTAEVVPQRGRHHSTFYRKRYVTSTIGTRPVPQFGRVLAKINVRANKNTAVNDRDYMAGKYLSAAYEHRHVPFISDLLVTTADDLSDKPYLDRKATRLYNVGGVDDIKAIVARAATIPAPELSEFLNEVYGIGLDDLVELYGRVAQSCMDYCDGWTRLDGKGGKKNVRGNSRYKAPMLCGDTVEALIRLDV